MGRKENCKKLGLEWKDLLVKGTLSLHIALLRRIDCLVFLDVTVGKWMQDSTLKRKNRNAMLQIENTNFCCLPDSLPCKTNKG